MIVKGFSLTVDVYKIIRNSYYVYITLYYTRICINGTWMRADLLTSYIFIMMNISLLAVIIIDSEAILNIIVRDAPMQ